MIFCETASGKTEHFDELSVFVNQLNAVGVPARISEASIPAECNRNQQFDIAAYIGEPGPDDHLVLIGAQDLNDQTLVRLRRMVGGAMTRCTAIGRFASHQAEIGLKAKLSYVLGQDPDILNLAPLGDMAPQRAPAFGVARPKSSGAGRVPTLLLFGANLDDAVQARSLVSLGSSRQLRPLIVTDGKSKQAWTAKHGSAIPVYHYGETLPLYLAEQIDIAIFFSKPSRDYRVQSLIANLAARGSALIDGTLERLHSKANDAFIQGPVDVATTGAFVLSEILPNLTKIGAAVRDTRFVAATSPKAALAGLGIPPREAPSPAPTRPVPSVWTTKSRIAKQIAAAHTITFVPTNGVGLGHAQRCSLIASELDRRQANPVFAAFPSCITMLKSYGFDTMPLVSRSPHHAQEHENDLVNYLRLRTLTQSGGTLAFDGGYVFDSIVRAIAENNLKSVWIRRGLWQPGQDNSIALDREKIFDRVIVPCEAFDELNEGYSSGPHVRPIGPIVQKLNMTAADRQRLRSEIAHRYGRAYKRLAVTMLGGGVAADRKAQTNAICSMMERHKDTLHLVVVWPTATVEAGAFCWENTHVVKTHHASALVAAADLFISAAGYNSFNEVLYNRVPAIFIPQMSAYMDDQRARAIAAANRGAAVVVEDSEMLTLGHEIGLFLNEGKSEAVRTALSSLVLPDPGNVAAARLIKELDQ